MDNLRKSNRAISFRETPLKLFTRWYLTPKKIHDFYPTASPNCFRGCSEQGTFVHKFWSCTFLKPIWHAVANRIKEATGKTIELTPRICLLFASVLNIPTICNRLIHSLFSSIQWMIAYNWRSNNLIWSQVLSRMEMMKLTERIHHTLHDNMYIFSKNGHIGTCLNHSSLSNY